MLRSDSFRSSKGRSYNHYNCNNGLLLYHLVVLYSDLVVGILRAIIIVVNVGGRSRNDVVDDVLLERGFVFLWNTCRPFGDRASSVSCSRCSSLFPAHVDVVLCDRSRDSDVFDDGRSE